MELFINPYFCAKLITAKQSASNSFNKSYLVLIKLKAGPVIALPSNSTNYLY
jgi:hypothetical protein